MAIKVGNTWVTQEAYAYASGKAQQQNKEEDMLGALSKQFPDIDFSTNTEPFKAEGMKNVAISPAILRKMQNDPEKRMEFEALIYDINSLQKNMPTTTANGSKITSQGFVIDGQGQLSGWAVSQSSGVKQKSSFMLPKEDKKSWLSTIMGEKKAAKQPKPSSKLNRTV